MLISYCSIWSNLGVELGESRRFVWYSPSVIIVGMHFSVLLRGKCLDEILSLGSFGPERGF